MRVIAIVGPTAVGKTSLSIDLAKKIGGEVVSADSRQVYRGLTIGTGKVTKKEMRGVPHYLIDVADPKKQFTAHDYVRLGRHAIADIVKRGKIPIVIGGTGLYVDTLLGRRSVVEVPPNPKLRSVLEKLPLKELQAKLKKLDRARYKTIDLKNPRRLIRAIEIASAPKPRTYTLEPKTYSVTWIGLMAARPVLKKLIIDRLHERLDAGMLKEAKKLHKAGLSYKRMEELGLEYRYMARHLQKIITYEQMVTQLDSEIYKYAKRQMTWFNANKDVQWFDITHRAQALAACTRAHH